MSFIDQNYLTILAVAAVFICVLILAFSIVLRKRQNAEAQLQHDYSLGQYELEQQKKRSEELNEQVNVLNVELAEKQSRILELERTLAAEQAYARAQKQASEREAQSAQETRAALAKEFELLAGRVLEAKQAQFDKTSKDQWQALIAPFKEQLVHFNHRVEEAHKVDSAQRNQLLGQILELQKQSQEVSREAFNLSNTLRGNNKTQGLWGELILEHVLQQSGLMKGREYDVQVSQTTDDGKRFQPDAVIHLPEHREVIVDSKVSLVAYERMANATTEDETKIAEKQLIDSIKAHVKNLSTKQYSDVINGNTLDFVLMFIPIEAAFVRVVHNSPELLAEAFGRKIAIVSPSSLMAVLKTIESLWNRQKQDENVQKIVTGAGKLYDQFVLFTEALDDVGVNLKRADESFVKAKKRMLDGRGNLVKRVEDLRKLGAKTSKTIADNWIADFEPQEDEADEVVEEELSTNKEE